MRICTNRIGIKRKHHLTQTYKVDGMITRNLNGSRSELLGFNSTDLFSSERGNPSEPLVQFAGARAQTH